MVRQVFLPLSVLLAVLVPGTAQAAPLDSALTWPWALPFIGILLTIAIAPLRAPKLWRHHHGKLAFIWAALVIFTVEAILRWHSGREPAANVSPLADSAACPNR